MKKYDIVNTNKMSLEYDASLIVGDCVAVTALENGRFVYVDEVAKTVRYAQPTDTDWDNIYLNVSVEKSYSNEGLTEFIVPAGEKPRVAKTPKGDIFETTAIEGVVVKGDKLAIGTDGRVVKSETGTMTAIDMTKLGYDASTAVKIKM